jgi:hypothetical protein
MDRAPAARSPVASCTNEAALKERSASHGNREAMEWKVCVYEKRTWRRTVLVVAGSQHTAQSVATGDDGANPRSPNPTPPPKEGDESGKERSDKERARDPHPASTASLLAAKAVRSAGGAWESTGRVGPPPPVHVSPAR